MNFSTVRSHFPRPTPSGLSLLALLVGPLLAGCASERVFSGGEAGSSNDTGGRDGGSGSATSDAGGSRGKGSGGKPAGGGSPGGASTGGRAEASGGLSGETGGAGPGGGGDPSTGGASNGGGATGGVPATGGSTPQQECEADELDCNGDDSDGCEVKLDDIDEPELVKLLRPTRSGYTGSLHAPTSAKTLRPTLEWSSQESSCGQLHYEIEMDDACSPGKLASCTFGSPEVQAQTTKTSFEPKADLPVSDSAPVGAFYGWRVRACDASKRCSAWSPVAGLNVGRTAQDLNGDGFADIAIGDESGLRLYSGSFAPQPADVASLSTKQSRPFFSNALEPRFVGDLNADGFADLAIIATGDSSCGDGLTLVHLVFGRADLSQASWQPICETRGDSFDNLSIFPAGDLNGDGFDELSIARYGISYGPEDVTILSGGADGIGAILAVVAVNSNEFISTNRFNSARGDHDGDGYPDLVCGGRANISILHGAAKLPGRFDTLLHPTECQANITSLGSAGDVDDDGDDDWVLTCSDATETSLTRFGLVDGGQSTGPFLLKHSFATKLRLTQASRALDFDNDEQLEFIIGVAGETTTTTEIPVVWQPGVSDVNDLFRPIKFSVSEGLTIADHNGNGRFDLALGHTYFGWIPAAASLSTEAKSYPTNSDEESFLGF